MDIFAMVKSSFTDHSIKHMSRGKCLAYQPLFTFLGLRKRPLPNHINYNATYTQQFIVNFLWSFLSRPVVVRSYFKFMHKTTKNVVTTPFKCVLRTIFTSSSLLQIFESVCVHEFFAWLVRTIVHSNI